MYKEIIIRNSKIKHDGLTRSFNLTNKDVRDFITKLDFWYLRHPEYAVLDKNYENADIPNQAYSFYQFLAVKQKIPTLTELVQFYFKQYCKQLDDNTFMFRPKYWTGIREHGLGIVSENRFPITAYVGRLARAYTTFLREVELLTRMQDAGYQVQYSFDDDNNGIDLKVFGKEQTLCIKEFVATSNSLRKLREKELVKTANRYRQKIVHLPLHMTDKHGKKNSKMLNNIFLYDDNTTAHLLSML